MPEEDGKKDGRGAAKVPMSMLDLLTAQKNPYYATSVIPESARGTSGSEVSGYALEHARPYSAAGSQEMLELLNYSRQGGGEIAWRATKQFGVNAASAFGQAIANTWDMIGHYNTIKGEFNHFFGDGKMVDNFDSGLMGTSVRDMKNWAREYAENNAIYEKNPGKFNLTDPGWWGNQFASAGTSMGMALAAAAEAGVIEMATGGLGTEAALLKLGNTFKSLLKIRSVARAGEVAAEAFEAAKGMRSVATMWGTLNGIAEGRMESQDTFDSITEELSRVTDVYGNRKYTDEQVQQAATEGARRDFHYNLALIPMNILAMRAMVWNPITGAAEGGIVEKAMTRIASVFGKGAVGKMAGKALPWVGEQAMEGLEEGYQAFGSDEGMHRAKVLVGEEKENAWMSRLIKEFSSDEFWNNVAGGIIGSPATGAIMKGLHESVSWNRKKVANATYKDYIATSGKMDDATATAIRDLDIAGEHEKASNLRAMLNRDQTIDYLYMDEQMGKTSLLDTRTNFVQGVLNELNAGKTTALKDLGFNITDKTDLDKIKSEFEGYLEDINKLKTIFGEVKYDYHKGAIPQVTRLKFNIDKLSGSLTGVQADIQAAKGGILDYENLTENGKMLHDANYELEALAYANLQLARKLKKNNNEYEKKNIKATIKNNDDRMLEINNEVNKINTLSTDEYSVADREKDVDINKGLKSGRSRALTRASRIKALTESEVSLGRKNMGLWNDEKYRKLKNDAIIENARVQSQANNVKEDAKDPKPKEQVTKIDEKTAKINAAETAELNRQQQQVQAELIKTQQAAKTANLGNTGEKLGAPVSQAFSDSADDLAMILALQEDVSEEGDMTLDALFGKAKDILGKPLTKEEKIAATKQDWNDQLDAHSYESTGDLKDDEVPLGMHTGKAGVGKRIKKADADRINAEYSGRLSRVDDETAPGIEFDGGDSRDPWSPVVGDMSEVNKKQKLGYKLAVERMLNRIGNNEETTFEDLIRHQVEASGPGATQKAFVALYYGWLLNARPQIDYSAVWDNVFGKMEQKNDTGTPISTGTHLADSQQKQSDAIAAKESKNENNVGHDNNNQPQHRYNTTVTSDTEPRGAYNHMRMSEEVYVDENGDVIVNRENIGELGDSNNRWVDSSVTLDYDVVKKGSKTTIRIPSDYRDMYVPIFHPDGTRTYEKMGAWMDRTGFGEGSWEFMQKVPMVHYLDGYDNNGKGIMQVHDVEWYGPTRFDATKPENMQKAIDNTIAIRQEVYLDYISGRKEGVKATITNRRENTFKPLKLPVGQEMSVSQASPQSQLGIIVGSTDPKNVFIGTSVKFEDNERSLNNGASWEFVGEVVDIRRVGYDAEGKELYTAFPVINGRLEADAKRSVIEAIKAYAYKDAPSSLKIRQAIIDGMGLDIYNIQNFEEYLKCFINVRGVKGLVTVHNDPNIPETVHRAARVRNPHSRPYFTIEKEKIIFGQSGVDLNSPNGHNFVIDLNKPDEVEANLRGLVEPLNMTIEDMKNRENVEQAEFFLDWYRNNFNSDVYNAQKNIVVVTDDQGGTRNEGNYKDYMHNKVKTNIKTVNVGTEEKPKHITTVQPSLNYDTDDRIANREQADEDAKAEMMARMNTPEKIAERKQAAIDSIRETPDYLGYIANVDGQRIIVSKYKFETPEAAEADLRRQIDEHYASLTPTVDTSGKIEAGEGEEAETEGEKKPSAMTREEAQKKIDEFNRNNNDAENEDEDGNFSARVLDDSQASEIDKTITRIAGLTTDEQGQIVTQLYHDVAIIVDRNNGHITVEACEEQVKKSLREKYAPIKEKKRQELAEIDSIIAQFPDLAPSQKKGRRKAEKTLAKMEVIERNLDKLMELVYIETSKNTNIKQTREKFDDDTREDGGDEGLEKDDQDFDPDEITMGKTDFFTDVLSENPEHKVTRKIRRFFRHVKRYGRDGKPLEGFLEGDRYFNEGELIRKLMVMLVETPSKFEYMMDRMRQQDTSGTNAWIKQAIDMLEDADPSIKKAFTRMMTNTSLRMKFAMVDFKNGKWITSIKNTNRTTVAETIHDGWIKDFENESSITTYDENGNVVILPAQAQKLIDKFISWQTGTEGKPISADLMLPYATDVAKVKTGESAMIVVEPNTTLGRQMAPLPFMGEVRFTKDGKEYRLMKLFDSNKNPTNQYVISLVTQGKIETSLQMQKELDEWLKAMGVQLSEGTINALVLGQFKINAARVSFENLFSTTNTSVFGDIFKNLVSLVQRSTPDKPAIIDIEGGHPLDSRMMKTLAFLDSHYNPLTTTFSFRDGGKSFFGVSTPKFGTDRVRELLTRNSTLRQELRSCGFNGESFYLRLLDEPGELGDDFRSKFGLFTLGETAIREYARRPFKDVSIDKLSRFDHELCKLSFFWNQSWSKVVYSKQGLKHYPSTDIALRMGHMWSPTMADKAMMTMMNTVLLNLQTKDLLSTAPDGTKQISNQVVDVIYQQCIKPELIRMSQFHGEVGGKTNDKNYDTGAKLFLMMPEANNLEIEGVNGNQKVRDAIAADPNTYTVDKVEKDPLFKAGYRKMIRDRVEALVAKKMEIWEDIGFKEVGPNGEHRANKYMDTRYMSKFVGDAESKFKQAAYDFVINSLVANANSFMVFANDPATFYKAGEDNDFNLNIKSTFNNALKRLAYLIAPRNTLAEAEDDKFIQVFLKDRKNVESDNMEYLERLQKAGLMSPNKVKLYGEIKPSDAQEYNTWKEHLDILSRMGKTTDNLLDITQEDIDKAAEIFSNEELKTMADLSTTQKEIVMKVINPHKPVFTGQIYDPEQKRMRTVYIKSSSFPLIPQLTRGLDIDHLRESMEKLQKDKKLNVRASFGTANKVGALSDPLDIYDADGKITPDRLTNIANHTMVLPRKFWGIQQEVPYKAEKGRQINVTLGSQLMKGLFGNDIINLSGFELDGQPKTGLELHNEYTQAFVELFDKKQKQLFAELGLDNQGKPINQRTTLMKLHNLLKNEAIKREYPLQSIEGLNVVAIRDNANNITGYDFNMPLWMSTDSNRFEALLNSIVSNRLVRVKMPGTQSVVGSPEGFRQKSLDQLSAKDRSQIIYTSAWNPETGLTSTIVKNKNGKDVVQRAQILVASRFTDNTGKLIDLFKRKGDHYVYIKEEKGPNGSTGYTLKTEMFDEETLKQLTFRTPTSGLESGAAVEIAGFLPPTCGDLMIVPSSFTTLKGLDFDIDKESAYHFWTYTMPNGKIARLKEEHRPLLLAAAKQEIENNKQIKELYDQYKKAETPYQKQKAFERIQKARENLATLDTILGSDSFTAFTEEEIEDMQKAMSRLDNAIDQKLLQNKIIAIHHAVYENPSDEIQAKLLSPVNTEYMNDEAKYLETLGGDTVGLGWTPLSDEYQKDLLFGGISGKTGTGAYSLDMVMHSLVQQAVAQGYDMSIQKKVAKDVYENVGWRFGRVFTDGKLGRQMTLGLDGKDGDRIIAQVIGERQNVALDNAALQLMDVLGLTDFTMDADKVFVALGIDKGEDGHSIATLFLRQPIIRRFEELIKNSESAVFSVFDMNKQQTAISKVLAEFGGAEGYNNVGGFDEQFTNATMAKCIEDHAKGGKPDGNIQGAILKRFLDMKAYGLAMRTAQTALNFKNNSLGKSTFDVIEKKDALTRLGTVKAKDPTDKREHIGLISNLTALVGDYKPYNAYSYDLDLAAGYVHIGEFMVKPTTYVGSMVVTATMTAYNLWQEFLPYDGTSMRNMMDQIMKISGSGEELMGQQVIQTKQHILQNYRKYLNTSTNTGIVGSSDNVALERYRLSIDDENNVSLPRYLKHLMAINNNAVINEFLKPNMLLNKFEYDIITDGTGASRIVFQNAQGAENDEQYLYDALANLLTARDNDGKRIKLPKLGNKEYTLDSLAQDIIAYCIMRSSMQTATEYGKFLPMSYFNAVGYTGFMRYMHSRMKGGSDVTKDGLGTVASTGDLNRYTIQYFQHFPEKIKNGSRKSGIYGMKLDRTSMQDPKLGLKLLDNQKLEYATMLQVPGESQPKIIAIYDQFLRTKKKFHLFLYTGANGLYQRIPTVGSTSFDEYSMSNDVVDSVIGKQGHTSTLLGKPAKSLVTMEPISTVSSDPQDVFKVNSNKMEEVLNTIAQAKLGQLSNLAAYLTPYMGHTFAGGIKYADSYTDIVSGKTYTSEQFDGVYLNSADGIILSSRLNSYTQTKGSRLILHETVHGLTRKQMAKYIRTDPDTGEVIVTHANPPSYVTELVRLYNDVRSKADKIGLAGAQAKVKSIKQGKSVTLTQAEYNEFYGLTDIYEFMSEMLANPEFQQSMAQTRYKQSDRSVLQKFADIIKQVLESIGVKFPSDTAAYQAIASIFEFIEAENPAPKGGSQDQFQQNTNNTNTDIDDFLKDMGNRGPNWQGDVGLSVRVSDFPEKKLRIRNLNCN